VKIDYRKNIQYLKINNEEVYVWLYKKKNFISFGINGTSLHFVILDYKNKSKDEIINIINKKIIEAWEV
jgi:hypothetical protein